ncbi:hypothetical protein FKP32DRAFT_1564557, partial [Trametes sanguinea]
MANRTYLGNVPPELERLSFIEEQLIARCRAKTCVIHLRTDKEDENSPVLANAQRALKGHVIIHPQRPEQLATVLPPVIDDILAPICVIFVGSRMPSKEWLVQKAKPLVVRRGYVLAALRWLQAHNPLYKDVTVDDNRISALPEHGILPHDVQHLQSDESTTSVTDRYDTGSLEHIEDISLRDIDRRDVPFHKVVLTDVDGRAPASELRAAALRHVKHKGGGYVEVPHVAEPVNEFCNPSLFPMIYPTLFPYGIGGFEDKCRSRALSLRRHVRHL